LRIALPDGFSQQEQGVFLARVARFVRERDPNAVIVAPVMSAPVMSAFVPFVTSRCF